MWRAVGGGVEDTLLCLIMLFMLQLTHHANHTVDGSSHTSHVTLVVHTIYAHAIYATAYSSC